MTAFDETKHPRAKVGTFTDKTQNAPELTIADRPHANREPNEVDENIVELFKKQAPFATRIHRARKTISDLGREEAEFQRTGVRKYRWATTPEAQIEQANATIATNQVPFDAIQEQIDPLNDEFDARGGWSRFFVTTGSNPHVHSSQSCSTCYPTTEFGWLTDHSGMDEEEIVELAGDEACTVCFPSAPVADRNAPRQNRLETPDGRAARIEREAANAARAAKKAAVSITSPTGEPVYDSYRSAYKTERGAELAAVGDLADAISYGNHPSERAWIRNAMCVEEALAAKHGLDISDVRESWKKKLSAKAKRDGFTDRFVRNGDRIIAKIDAMRDERASLEGEWESLSSAEATTESARERIAEISFTLDQLAGKREMKL